MLLAFKDATEQRIFIAPLLAKLHSIHLHIKNMTMLGIAFDEFGEDK